MNLQVDELYTGYSQQALVMAQGDFEKADYLLNCSWFEYMYRRDQHRRYQEWYEKQMKTVTGKG
ncbi:hypothetical protein [Chitinophaga sp. YIM B06452]|uniref:hypothetical protein n=1 Tax=Chitinophaga sp. YIM B06452 TaxID=3082158 RepID=UPI0031FEEB7D